MSNKFSRRFGPVQYDLTDTFNFKKHPMENVKKVINEDPGWVRWMIDKGYIELSKEAYRVLHLMEAINKSDMETNRPRNNSNRKSNFRSGKTEDAYSYMERRRNGGRPGSVL